MKKAKFQVVWPASLLLATAMIMPATAHAQAWLPAPGQGSIYVGYEYSHVHWTLMPVDVTGRYFGPYIGEGKRVAKGAHFGQFATVDLDYGIRKGLALTVHVPYALTKYMGLYPAPDDPETSTDPSIHWGTHGIDDGKYHGTFQDADIGLHLNVLNEPFVATPFVSLLLPLQAYEAEGHSAAGAGLRELEVGAALARPLRPFLPDAYGQVTYTYAAAERVLDHSFHTNRLLMELGYFVTPRVSLKGAADLMKTSGGLDWNFGPEHIAYRAHHDRLANQRWLRAGGGASYALTPRSVLYIYGFWTVTGENTHAVSTIATGVGRNFASPWARKAPSGL